jgi:hypothetical protein
MRRLSWAAIALAIGVALVAAPQVSFADGFARDRAKVTDGVKTTKAKAKVSCTGQSLRQCHGHDPDRQQRQRDAHGNGRHQLDLHQLQQRVELVRQLGRRRQ